MTIDEINILNDKAKTRKDGVYSFRGNLWAVKKNKFVAYVDNKGIVFQRYGSFNYQAGDFSYLERWERKTKFIKSIAYL